MDFDVTTRGDLRACARCSRPAWLYGLIDLDTHWQGWCCICNIRWKRNRCLRIVESVLRRFRHMVGGVSDYIIAFLVPCSRIQHERAMRTLWTAIILGKSHTMMLWGANGAQRAACTDDELSDGTCDPELLYVNPLWKLQLARSRYPRYRIGRPMQILLRLLGTPLETPLKK
jgi:hypothetical protein